MNQMKENYDRRMREEIRRMQAEKPIPRLLLHACCAPCSSACLERLRQDFLVTVFYYNPNIDREPEYRKRLAEEKRLIEAYNQQVEERDYRGMLFEDGAQRIGIIEGDYRPAVFHETVQGLEQEPEGGLRCSACFRLRLRETARVAAEGQFDCFTTTLTISPLKDADRLNRIGQEAGKAFGIPFLPSDFKKRDGFKRSIELSKRFDLYRQDHCGCSYSVRSSQYPPA